MAPRGQTLPEATTESAREARKSFFCELCQKGYARMNDFEAHEGSYDHQHRKRLKEMKQLTKDPLTASKAREAERRANEEAGLKTINLASASAAGGTTGSGGSTTATATTTKKKPVFRSTLQPQNASAVVSNQRTPSTDAPSANVLDSSAEDEWMKEYDSDPTQMVANGWRDQAYDVRFATICPECGGLCKGHGGMFDPRESLQAWRERMRPEVERWVERLGTVGNS